MAKFTKAHKGMVPQTGPCKATIYTSEQSKAFILEHFFGTPCEDTDRNVFAVILGRDVSAREFDTARAMGLVE